jgi:hypothetical protein
MWWGLGRQNKLAEGTYEQTKHKLKEKKKKVYWSEQTVCFSLIYCKRGVPIHMKYTAEQIETPNKVLCPLKTNSSLDFSVVSTGGGMGWLTG